MEAILAIGRKGMELFTLMAFIVGLAWFVAKPQAEEFIKDTVKERLTSLETTADQIKKQQQDQNLSSIRTESDLSTVKATQRDMQDSLRLIIQKLIEEH